MPSCFCGCITQILCNIFTINITFCQAGFTYVQSWATMYLYILLIGGIISIMKKQFLKGLLIKITSAVSATVLVFSAFAADTQAAAYSKVYSETTQPAQRLYGRMHLMLTQAAAFLLMLIQVPFFSRGTLMKNVIQPAQPRF